MPQDRDKRKARGKRATVTTIEAAKLLKFTEAVDQTSAASLKRRLSKSHAIEDLERAVAGLREEDEFAVMCYLMGTSASIVELGQRPLIKNDLIIPDFKVRFVAECAMLGYPRNQKVTRSCLVDVKSTTKDAVKIKGSLLERRRKYAQEEGVPLLFAVRFVLFGRNAVWVIKWDEDQSKSALTVKIGDLTTSASRFLWNDYGLFINPSLRFVRIYDHTSKAGVRGEHGSLVQLRIVARTKQGDTLDETVDAVEANALFLLTEALQMEVQRTETRGPITQEIMRPRVVFAWFSDIVWRMNHVLTDVKGNRLYDSSKIVAHADSEKPFPLFERPACERLIGELINRECLFYGRIGEAEELRASFETFFSVKQEDLEVATTRKA